jgi:hypothetical protein
VRLSDRVGAVGLALAVGSIIVGLAAALAIVPAFANSPHSPPNTKACTEYSRAFNAVADMASEGVVNEVQAKSFVSAWTAMTVALKTAHAEATGAVARALKPSAGLAAQVAANGLDQIASAAFYVNSQDVASACISEGIPTDLHSFQSNF